MGYRVKIVQQLSELPDLAGIARPVAIDTETSGLWVHHGCRICGIALGWAGGGDVQTFYLPLRHVALSSSFSGSDGPGGALQGGANHTIPLDPFINLDPDAVFAWLRPFAADPRRAWVMHNAEFDLGMFRADGVEFAGTLTDTMVFAHGVRGDRMSYELDVLTADLEHPEYAKLQAYLEETQSSTRINLSNARVEAVQKDYSYLPVNMLGPYACEDIFCTLHLFGRLCKTKLVGGLPENAGNPSRDQLACLKSDRDLVRVLFEMSWTGVKLDFAAIVAAREDALRQAWTRYWEMVGLAGGEAFNPSSAHELSAAFERVGGKVSFWLLKKERRGKQKAQQITEKFEESTKRPCWNAAALLKYLEKYQEVRESSGGSGPYRFLSAYRDYSQLTRLRTTYLEAYLRLADAREILHGHFDPTGTCTGRLSSRNPNLQNVTKTEDNADTKALEEVLDDTLLGGGSVIDDFKLVPFYQFGQARPEYSDELDVSLARRIRSFFIPRKPGNWIVAIDYSSVEYRVAAYLTGDAMLIDAFKKHPDLDFHQYCAELIWGKTDDPKQRKTWRGMAKTVNFGTLYGMGDKSLAAVLRKPLAEAVSIRTRLFAKIPGMKRLITRVKIDADNHGYVQNPLGRVCYVPQGRGYVGLNYLDQGFCGDIMRRALIRVRQLLAEKGWASVVLMMLTVHDEIVFEMPEALVEMVATEIAGVMCDVPEVGLPLTAEIEVGRNWGELESLSEWRARQRCLSA